MAERQEFVNKSIDELSLDIDEVFQAPLKYALRTGGKRLRPIICMLSSEISGGTYRNVLDGLLSLELIHNATLIHDDVIDNDAYRRGVASVHASYGDKIAILSGDYLLSLSLSYATKTGNLRVVESVTGAAGRMSLGVILQTIYRRKIVPISDYLRLAYLKSGSLFEAAAELGGLMNLVSDDIIEKLRLFGRNFGVAYQIRDDITDLYEAQGEKTRSDLSNGDLTLPLIYALQSDALSDSDGLWIRDLYERGEGKLDIKRLRSAFEDSSAMELSLNKMREYASNAWGALDSFPQSDAKDCIYHLLDQNYLSYLPDNQVASATLSDQ
jgi:octaprenyl-diphosphate synthase